jgi:ubiquitin C-terminal hydrolase
MYTPIGIIYHHGLVLEDGVMMVDQTSGHYMADVKTPENIWFRTDDKNIPIKVTSEDVSHQVTIILYKQM